ncbi:MAG: intradiol ring-cleavage dioxygenase, partial [Bacteroidota bacterium]
AAGRYKFTSIRPASYPGTEALQHIHPLIKEPGIREYWIDEYLFDDDPNMKKNEMGHEEKRGGSGIIHLEKNAGGTWIGRRDIVLGLNVPGY